jgi:hypothetical protein
MGNVALLVRSVATPMEKHVRLAMTGDADADASGGRRQILRAKKRHLSWLRAGKGSGRGINPSTNRPPI